MMVDRRLRIIIFLLLLLLIVVFIFSACPIPMQNDTLYDIKLGERYMTTGMFKFDDYSFHEGLVYQTHHYLVCIISYLLYNLFSFKGLYYLMVILLSLMSFLFYKFNKTMIESKFLAYILLFVQIIAISPFISMRAQMYSYIIFMIEIYFIEKYLSNNKKDYLVILSLLPLLLINFHSGVIYFYFIILATYLFNYFNFSFKRLSSDKRVNKRSFKHLAFVGVVGGLFTLINPYGIEGFTYGLKTLNSYYISNFITEFQTIKLFTPMGILVVSYVLLCLFSLRFSRKKIIIHEILLLFGTIFMTFISIRHFSLLVITSVVILPHIGDLYNRINKGDWDIVSSLKKGVNLTNIIVISFYMLMLFKFSFVIATRNKEYLPIDQYPLGALEYINANLSKKAHIFNQYEWGSYLMFNNVKTFIDSRCDLFNEEYNINTTVMKDYIDVMYNNKHYDYVVSKYGIEYFLLHRDSLLSFVLSSDPKYEIIYSDSISFVIKERK